MIADLRFHPADAICTTHVYETESLRLMSTLDENNYASFTNYDEEGSLVQVKKETARGVFTISQSRMNTQGAIQ